MTFVEFARPQTVIIEKPLYLGLEMGNLVFERLLHNTGGDNFNACPRFLDNEGKTTKGARASAEHGTMIARMTAP
jgi:hypothetical protein